MELTKHQLKQVVKEMERRLALIEEYDKSPDEVRRHRVEAERLTADGVLTMKVSWVVPIGMVALPGDRVILDVDVTINDEGRKSEVQPANQQLNVDHIGEQHGELPRLRHRRQTAVVEAGTEEEVVSTEIPTICHGCGLGLLAVFYEDGQPYHFGCRPSQQQVILSRVGCMFCPDKDARIAELEAELAEAYEVISHFKQGAEGGNAGG
jgi:hypothetical protein